MLYCNTSSRQWIVDHLQEELQHLQFLQLPSLKAGVAGSMAGSDLFKDLELYRAEVLAAHEEDDVKVLFFMRG